MDLSIQNKVHCMYLMENNISVLLTSILFLVSLEEFMSVEAFPTAIVESVPGVLIEFGVFINDTVRFSVISVLYVHVAYLKCFILLYV
jgi:hypothetical protein